MRRRWSDSYGQTAGAIGTHLLLGVFSSSQAGYLEGAPRGSATNFPGCTEPITDSTPSSISRFYWCPGRRR
ncbi:hypothetical protein RSAG8_12141, partial [Rhizoctonia solani AG-8 WAC10335]